jgi:hypothetical protein
MNDSFDLRAEIARVQAELIVFRKECLPAFLSGPVQDFLADGMSEWLKRHIVTVAGRLSEWHDAALRLAEYLPLGPLSSDAPTLDRKDFGRFLFQEATPAFVVRDGRIVWRVEVCSFVDMALRRCAVFEDKADAAQDGWERFLGRVEDVKRWLMGLPLDCQLANSLCYLLPFVADADPAFVKLALDPDTWRGVVRADRGITEEERTKRMKLVDGYWFCHVLNNALLHTLGGLANNHFLDIRDFHDHPMLVGGYTHLMPHYLFAVLFEKVRVLRRLSQERHGLGSTAEPTAAG